MRIRSGTLNVVDAFNGFYLYGFELGRGETFIACMGDTLPYNSYDPNDDEVLPEAYDFELVD